jgi:hypothetical protein
MKKIFPFILLAALLVTPLSAHALSKKKPVKKTAVKIATVLNNLLYTSSLDYAFSGALRMNEGSTYSGRTATITGTSNGKLSFTDVTADTTNYIKVIADGFSDTSSSQQLNGEASFKLIATNGNAFGKYSFINFNVVTTDKGADDLLRSLISKYKESWIKLDYSIPSYNELKSSVFNLNKGNLSASIQELEKSGVLMVTRLNDSKVINNIKAQHYLLKINAKKALDLHMKEYKTNYGNVLTKEQIDSITKEYLAYKVGTSDLWIDEARSLPVRYVMVATHNKSDRGFSAKEDYSIQLDLSNFNVPVYVETPASALNMNAVEKDMNDTMNMYYFNANKAAHVQQDVVSDADAYIQSDASNMRAQAELYYSINNNSYSGLCTNTTSSGTAKYLIDDITKRSGQVPLCREEANGTAWVLTAKITNKYWCVDSTGASLSKNTTLPYNFTSCNY